MEAAAEAAPVPSQPQIPGRTSSVTPMVRVAKPGVTRRTESAARDAAAPPPARPPPRSTSHKPAAAPHARGGGAQALITPRTSSAKYASSTLPRQRQKELTDAVKATGDSSEPASTPTLMRAETPDSQPTSTVESESQTLTQPPTPTPLPTPPSSKKKLFSSFSNIVNTLKRNNNNKENKENNSVETTSTPSVTLNPDADMISRFKTQVMNQSSSVSTSKFSFPHIGKRPIASITRSPSETEVEPDSKKLETTSDTIQAAAAISSSPSEIIKKKPWFPETVSKCTTEMDDPLHNPYTFKFKCPKKSAMKASSASATASASASLAISALPPPSKTKLQQEKSGSSSPIVVGDLDDQFLVKGYVDTEIQVSIVVSRLNTLLKDVVSHLEREIEALVGQKVRIVLMRTKDKDSEWVDVHVGGVDKEVEEIDWRIRVSECWDHQMLVHLVVEV